MGISQPLLLLPGMMCDRRLWQAQIDGLEDLCEPIVVADLGGAASVAQLARQVLATAPPRFALAGLSMGGIVAFELWRQAPQRITRLALLDTNARAELPERRALRAAQIERAQKNLPGVVAEELLPNYFSRPQQCRPAADTVLQMALALGAEVFARQSLALRERPDSAALLPLITCPALVMCGADDVLCPPDYHQFMAAQIPRAQLVVIPDCGHLSTLERPREVNRALRQWLQGADQQQAH